MTPTCPIVSLTDVTFQWGASDAYQLHVPKFELAAASTTLLLGESGSGKSTLLSLICGTISPATGSIEVAGFDTTSMSGAERDAFRAENIGVIFQQFNLLPFATVEENICLPLGFASARKARANEAGQTAKSLSQALQLPASLLNRPAARLSVGQQQRVAVARALIGAPKLIVADEPTSALDAATQSAFLDILFSEVKKSGLTLLFVSHDERLSEKFDQVVQLSDIADLSRGVA